LELVYTLWGGFLTPLAAEEPLVLDSSAVLLSQTWWY